jgi:HEAT repeat protein
MTEASSGLPALTDAALRTRTPAQLVTDLADRETRFPAYFALDRLGASALPEIRDGLKHEAWEVRRWSAALLDHHADDEALLDLLPLLEDPMPKVRLWAVHSISCDGCKVGSNPLDIVPLLERRIEVDRSIRVRRMAAAMLSAECTLDARAAKIFERLLAEETDRKMLHHARTGRDRYLAAQ